MAQSADHTLMDPPIEDLLDKVDSKFTLVALSAKRARQINSYYNQLGEGLGVVVPPQVTSVSGKPLTIAFEEIAAGKATYHRPDPEEDGRGRGRAEAAGSRRSSRARSRRPPRTSWPRPRRRTGDDDRPSWRAAQARRAGAGTDGSGSVGPTSDRRGGPRRRPRRHRRHRRLQGGRGLPPAGRRRRPRRPGAHRATPPASSAR